MNLPKYKCHKEVRAALIAAVEHNDDGSAVLTLDVGAGLTHKHDVSPEWVQRHNPKSHEYFVRYEDGYESVSPAHAFEGGYTLIEG